MVIAYLMHTTEIVGAIILREVVSKEAMAGLIEYLVEFFRDTIKSFIVESILKKFL